MQTEVGDSTILHENGGKFSRDSVKSRIGLRREVTFFETLCFIVGNTIGAGIFITPFTVLHNAGSMPISLGMWCLSGFLTCFGALCYAELALLMPSSGGDYYYIMRVYGPMVAFMRYFGDVVVGAPSLCAVGALTCAEYFLKAIFPDCETPKGLQSIVAILVIGIFHTNYIIRDI